MHLNMMTVTETRQFDIPGKNTYSLLQGLHRYKMSIRDPLNPGLYTAENLLPIHKVQIAKGHWRPQKSRISAVFHWLMLTIVQVLRSWRSSSHFQDYTVFQLCSHLCPVKFKPSQLQTMLLQQSVLKTQQQISLHHQNPTSTAPQDFDPI